MAVRTAEETVMRAIVAREHRAAMAERRAAAAEARARLAPAPSDAGWSTRADRKTKPRGDAAARDKAQREIRAGNADRWRQRHRDVAAEERGLRVRRAEVESRWDHKRLGTPATYQAAAEAQTRPGSLARLYMSGAIDADQLAAAVEIATVAERIGADVAIRTASLETRIDTPMYGDGGFHEGLSRVRHEVAYSRWRAEVGRYGPAAAVLEMIVGDAVGFTVIARRYRMHNRRAKALLIEAIELWRRILHDVVKVVDKAAIEAAHAEIL